MGKHTNVTRVAGKILKRSKEPNRTAINSRITKTKSEIEDLTTRLYNLDDGDLALRLHNLKEYKIEILRGFILYAHLAIEDLLKDFLVYFLKKESRIFKVKRIRETVDYMRPSEIIEWCGRLDLITKAQYDQATALKKLRDACAHHWILNIPKYKRDAKTKKRTRVPVVKFKGKNLLNESVFFDEFMPVYSTLYLKLLSVDWKIKKYI